MENKPSSLNSHDLHALRWRLGGCLALVAICSSLLLDAHAGWLAAAAFCATVLVALNPRLPARIPKLADALAFPFVLVFFGLDWWRTGELVNALIRLDLLLVLYRAVTYRRRREDLQLIVLGLFLIVIVGVLTVSVAFVPCLFAFVGLALALLLTHTLAYAASGGIAEPPLDQAPEWAALRTRPLVAKLRRNGNWRVTGVWILLGGGVTGLTVLLFILIPRFELNRSLFLERFLTPRATTGFNDTLHFGDVTDIQKNDAVALRIDVPERAQIPRAPYWRMVVLDEYHNHSFRASPRLQASEYLPLSVASRLRSPDRVHDSNAALWTFYLEPGVSRYLPLPSTFSEVLFTEPQSVRFSPDLRLAQLSREPSSMKAFRVSRPALESRIKDPSFREESQRHPATLGASLPTFLDLGLTPDETATVRAITEGIRSSARSPSAADFSLAAVRWLHLHHTYSLSMELPSGTGDPLVRWLVSEAPGHCELYAAAFTVLTRTAGFPSRVVCGFVGGSWNQDYLILRNSDAHAWAEVYDSEGYWFRVDPTLPPEAQTGETQGRSEAGRLNDADPSWSSWLDRWRVRWYRQVVNFDQADQRELIRNATENVRESGKTIGVRLGQWVAAFRQALSGPWNIARIATLAWWLLITFPAFWALLRALAWHRQQRRARRQGLDPIRLEAGFWLGALASISNPKAAEIRKRLLRIRYGPRPALQEARALFAAARRLERAGEQKKT